TDAVLASYAKVLPLGIVTHRERRGYARSLEELLRLALQRSDRAKRDCAITLHADFVHSPESMEEMVKRIESGADLVVAEQREERGRAPRAVWLARRWTPRLLPAPSRTAPAPTAPDPTAPARSRALATRCSRSGRSPRRCRSPSASAWSIRRNSASSTSAPPRWRWRGSTPCEVPRPCTWCFASAAARCGTISSRRSNLGSGGATSGRAASGTRP